MSTFSVGGLSTGLDTKALIEQLVSIDSRPKMMLEWKSQLWNARKSAWSDLNSRLLNLQTLADGLLKAETWNVAAGGGSGTGPMTGTSGDPSRLSAVVGASATAGSYGIDVLQLARGEISTSSGNLGAPTAGSRATGFWYEAASNVVEGNENITALRSSTGASLGLNTNSTITMNFTVNGVAQSADFKVNTAANGGQGTTLTQFAAWVASTIGNGASASWGTGAEAGKLVVTTAPGTTAELDAMSFTAKNAANANLAAFNASVGAGSAVRVAATDGGVATNQTMTITNGSGSWNVALAAGDQKQDIVNKINATSGIGVLASLVGSDIQLRSTGTGVASAFSVSSTGTAAAMLNFVETQSAQDAQYTVNGVAHTSATNNNVGGAIPDVTLNLLGLTSTTLTIAQGSGTPGQTPQDVWVGKTKDKLKEFVKQYNAVLEMVHARTQGESKVVNPKTLGEYLQGSMARDVGFAQVGFDLRQMSMASVQGMAPGTSMLRDIGINTAFTVGGGGANGQLSIDEDKLDAALRADPAKVQEVLSKAAPGTGIADGDGIVRRISELVTQLRVDGRVDTALTNASSQIKLIQQNIDRASDRIDRRRTYYERMFSGLETTVGRIQSQGQWLQGQFAQLANGGGGF